MLGTLISAAVPIIGGLIGSSSNRRAADRASDAATAGAQIQADATIRGAQMQIDANREARQEFRQAADRGIAAIRAGTARYADTINPLLTPTPVALPTHRGLTASQQIARDDLRRQGQAVVAASGLRGAGRAGVGAILDADRRFVASAAEGNDREWRGEMRRAQGSADSARRGLASVYAQEGGAIANTEVGQGNRIGESIASDGRAMGSAVASGGQALGNAEARGGVYDAQATTANANLWGDAIGGLGSVIADSLKGQNWDKYRANEGSI